jgi:hypothetical protein
VAVEAGRPDGDGFGDADAEGKARCCNGLMG